MISKIWATQSMKQELLSQQWEAVMMKKGRFWMETETIGVMAAQ